MLKTNESAQHSQHITFDEVSKQVHHLRDLILWDIQRGFEIQDSEDEEYSHHLKFTKYWFMRVSSVNKKRFCLILLQDIPCAWTLSLLLKSIWNCQPKDAVASQYEPTIWSSYDQTPMDHNRTANPIQLLVEVMECDRRYFRSLEPSRQAEFLSELLKIAGGPIVWTVFRKAQSTFENYREDQLHNVLDSIAVNETHESGKRSPPMDNKKDARRKLSATGDSGKQAPAHDAQRELEMYLAQWTSIIKSVKDSQKLEELELSFSDGTKRRIWKVNRPKPEITETVDYFQLLPLTLAKRILDYLPRSQLADCARVNRYWAYLVDDFKAEIAARLKIDLDIEKLTELMLRHDARDPSMDTFHTDLTDDAYGSLPVSHQYRRQTHCYFSKHASQKSAATNIFKRLLRDDRVKLPPIRNLAQLSERLERRGAADDNLWDWCKIVLERYNPGLPKEKFKLPLIPNRLGAPDGIMDFGNIHFPCPLLRLNLTLPLKPPLCKDPADSAVFKKKQSNINASKINVYKLTKKRYHIWSRDFSSLYSAVKIANYKSPV